VKIIQQRLRALRESSNISQKNLGKLMNTTQASITRYENTMSAHVLDVLLWYADHFDVSLDYIFGRTDKPEGKLYEFKPKIENNDDMKMFIDMCFDPSSPMSGKLKDTLLQMMKGNNS